MVHSNAKLVLTGFNLGCTDLHKDKCRVVQGVQGLGGGFMQAKWRETTA